MRHYIIILILIPSILFSSQFALDKGSLRLGGVISYAASEGTFDDYQFILAVDMDFFITKGSAVGFGISYLKDTSTSSGNLKGISFKVLTYFNAEKIAKTSAYLKFEIGLLLDKYDDMHFLLNPNFGFAFFLNKYVSLDFLVGVQLLNDSGSSDSTSLFFGTSFNVYIW